MVSRREEIAYKYPRTPSREECQLAFTKEKTINTIHIETALLVSSENGRNDRQDTCRFKERHSEISDIEADHNYCTIFPRYSEHKRKLAASS